MYEENRCFASWYMTRSCNFDCSYCKNHDIGLVKENLPVQQLIKALNETGKKWIVGMTGGEPFLYPDFVQICKLLTEADIKIAVDTNLSISSKVKEFANLINPAHVSYLYVSSHMGEREKRGGRENFVKNLLLLKEKGFNFRINYVLHPTVIKKFMEDEEYFKSKGLYFEVKPYKGRHLWKRYPEAYSPSMKELILKRNPKAFRMLPFYSKGIRCNAGKTMVRIERDGRVLRCVADKTSLGDIFSGIKLNEHPEPCRVDFCPCFGGSLIQDAGAIERLRKQLN